MRQSQTHIQNTVTGARSSAFSRIRFCRMGLVPAGAAILALAAAGPVPTVWGQGAVVISQVYGGGGNFGATYTHDFIELFNRGDAAVSVTGWSVQYASATGSIWQITAISGTIQPGQYFLIQQAQGGGGTTPLPMPDAIGTINMAAANGKVALVAHQSLLSGTCPISDPGIRDFVGYGAANCFEGSSAAPQIGSTTSTSRREGGCMDTDDNGADFEPPAFPNPRNSSSPFHVCPSATNPVGVGTADPETVFAGDGVLLTVIVTPGANPDSTGIIVEGDLSEIGGSDTQAFLETEPGSNIFTHLAQTGCGLSAGIKAIPLSIQDAQDRTGSALPIEVTVNEGVTAGDRQVVISQVYGGGGDAGAAYQNDFVELFNKGATAVDVTGWSVQYAAAEGASWSSKVDLTPELLEPGQYYLIELAAGTGCDGAPCGIELPEAEASGSIDLSGAAGKVGLIKGSALLPEEAACISDCRVVDFVGYGQTADCYEGTGSAEYDTDNFMSARRTPICSDTDDNAADFMFTLVNPKGIPGDLNRDGHVDSEADGDLELFAACTTGAGVPYDPENLPVNCLLIPDAGGIIEADLDRDGDVDMDDFALWQRCYSGPEDPANPACLCP